MERRWRACPSAVAIFPQPKERAIYRWRISRSHVHLPREAIHREIQIGSLPLFEVGGQNRVFGNLALGRLEKL